MSRMGQRLMEAMQEMLDHSEGKIELRTSQLPESQVDEMTIPEEAQELEIVELHYSAKRA